MSMESRSLLVSFFLCVYIDAEISLSYCFLVMVLILIFLGPCCIICVWFLDYVAVALSRDENRRF